MIAIVHSIYSQSVHALALNARSMDNDAERYCIVVVCITRIMEQMLNNHLLNIKSKMYKWMCNRACVCESTKFAN